MKGYRVRETENLQDYSIDIQLAHPDDMMILFGTNERHLKVIEKALSVTIHARIERVQIVGEKMTVEKARLVINALLVLVGRGMLINTSDVVTALNMVQTDNIDKFVALYEEEIIKDNYGNPIRVKTLGQKVYIDSVKKHDIVFGIGPAGTGKTFLAVTIAVMALKRGQVKRIILTRPAVEAGESLGFLPGDLKEKVDPYLRPVYDALYRILGKDQTIRLMEREIIEIAPLAYMRGRTLDDAFVILDEAQNTTIMQMKMFLTRLGFNSKMIVNGDTSQIDLPRNVKSGLIDATEKLKNIEQIDFIYLSAKDVVRHPVVAEIITAYEDKEIAEETKTIKTEQYSSGLTNYEIIGNLPTTDES
ncbi:PhoH family protein [Streptococcus sciuri]|uniref:PhoH family protein n=1 Tax=Streptococcus sciuri TaxID=2973939 RepID=UPI003570DC18